MKHDFFIFCKISAHEYKENRDLFVLLLLISNSSYWLSFHKDWMLCPRWHNVCLSSVEYGTTQRRLVIEMEMPNSMRLILDPDLQEKRENVSIIFLHRLIIAIYSTGVLSSCQWIARITWHKETVGTISFVVFESAFLPSFLPSCIFPPRDHSFLFLSLVASERASHNPVRL